MNKKNLKLGGILIILIALAYLYQGPIKDWRSNLGKPDNFLANINVSEISSIEIVNSDKTIVLEKINDKWKIAGTKDFHLKEETARSLISGLEEAKKADLELVSTNKDKKSEFQTNNPSASSGQGIRVKLYQGENILVDFIVGKIGIDFASTYVSQPESDNTYVLKTNINSLFNKDEWYDKTIFSSDKEKITKIRFQYPDREFTVEKINNIWSGTFPYKFSVDEEKINKVLDITSNLIAAEIPEQTFEGTGLEKHLIIVQVTGENIDNTIMVGDNNGEDLYYAKKGDSDNIYLITKEQRDELDKKIWQIR